MAGPRKGRNETLQTGLSVATQIYWQYRQYGPVPVDSKFAAWQQHGIVLACELRTCSVQEVGRD